MTRFLGHSCHYKEGKEKEEEGEEEEGEKGEIRGVKESISGRPPPKKRETVKNKSHIYDGTPL